MNAFFSHFLYPLISRPTHLTWYSATLIDNIFTNNISASRDNGLIINDLYDHLPIFTLLLPFATSLVRILIMHLTTSYEFDWNSLIYADANAAYNGFLQKYTEFITRVFR
ncbi:unnamed protein product [Porites lobata]|uniref:Uncharacterized protein n=1 Tax=Porites lobata TaxID=104759 RepID=A0ABN8SDK8_9CNID|nr:unnamed protein product [Porites lobata]